MVTNGIEITKDFLEPKLNYSVKRIEVSPGSSLGDGSTCPLVAVDVWEDESSAEPKESLLVKCYPSDEARQAFLDKSRIFRQELLVYQTVIPELERFIEQLGLSRDIQLPFAKFLYGAYAGPEERSKQPDFNPRDNCIILKDLRKHGNFQLRDKFLGLSYDHCKLVLLAQARLHAISWAYKFKNELDLGAKFFSSKELPDPDLAQGFPAYNRASFEKAKLVLQDYPHTWGALERLEEHCTSVYGLYNDVDLGQAEKGHTKDSVLKRSGPLPKKEEPWTVVVHGDPLNNNLMFRYDENSLPVEVRFVDLQVSREADPLTDLALCLYMNTTKEFRKKNLQSLLHIYYEEFTSICETFYVPDLPGWSFVELERRFRRTKIWAAYMAVLIMPYQLNPEGQTTEWKPDGPQTAESHNRTSGTSGGGAQPVFSRGADVSSVLETRLAGIFEDLIEDEVL